MQDRYRTGRVAVPTQHVTRKLSRCHREGESRPRSGLAEEPPGGRPHSSFRIKYKKFRATSSQSFWQCGGAIKAGMRRWGTRERKGRGRRRWSVQSFSYGRLGQSVDVPGITRTGLRGCGMRDGEGDVGGSNSGGSGSTCLPCG
ncbi:hypothetical protein CGRA01v4_00701 [Colletotrichum graminicola]|nr:hypothetical protein CGRA01v4_00701 [Colletotrichum graminicola]